VDAYIQVTSPIRRYADMVMHRQIKIASAAPAGADPDDVFPPSAQEGVLHAVAAAEQAGDTVSRIERGTNRYFVLKHLESRKGQPLSVIVVAERDRGRWLVSIEEVALMASVVLEGGPKPRDVRTVEVVAASARDDRLQLKEVGQPSGAPESGG
jgi:exoribonuclease-2